MEKMSNSRRESSARDPRAWLLQRAGNLECCLWQGWIPAAPSTTCLDGAHGATSAGDTAWGHCQAGCAGSAAGHTLPVLPQGELWALRGTWGSCGARMAPEPRLFLLQKGRNAQESQPEERGAIGLALCSSTLNVAVCPQRLCEPQFSAEPEPCEGQLIPSL